MEYFIVEEGHFWNSILDILKKNNVIPILTNADEKSKYNVKNATNVQYTTNCDRVKVVNHKILLLFVY